MVRRVGSAACAMSEGKQRQDAGAFRGVCEETEEGQPVGKLR